MEVDSRHESKGEHKEEKFVNEGLIKWKEGRKKWLAAGKPSRPSVCIPS